MDKNFGLIGAAGYIAPRHMRAIKDNNCNLLAAVDPSDSVGIIDSYFPNASFFVDIERFDRHIDKLRHSANKIDYIGICSPNYLHDSHMRLALRSDCDAICEKPLVISAKNIEYLRKLEDDTGKKINCILQLRHHPTIIEIKNKYKNTGKKVDITLDYITSRGKWYEYSWKGDCSKSGGLAANIGVHFFDMLSWIFGGFKSIELSKNASDDISGILRLERANIVWRLSTNKENLPEFAVKSGLSAYRNIVIDGTSLEFSGAFTDLHTKSYSEILNGNGYGINDAEPSIRIINKIINNS
tara:strand:- start:7605 stop:8498 length:894 start_codon:yes stop_codon:yes gene_type:complete